MAIKEIRSLPDGFPPFTIYLDDVEAILRVLSESVERSKFASNNPATVRITIGDRTCDDVEDLRELGEKSKRIEITANGYQASFHVRYGSCGWHLALADADERAKVYGQLMSIISPREVRWKTSLRALPGWIDITVAWAFLLANFFVAQLLANRGYTHTSFAVTIAGTMLFICVAVVSFAAQFSPYRIYFRRSHEKRRREMPGKIVWIVVGAVIVRIIDIIVGWLRQHY